MEEMKPGDALLAETHAAKMVLMTLLTQLADARPDGRAWLLAIREIAVRSVGIIRWGGVTPERAAMLNDAVTERVDELMSSVLNPRRRTPEPPPP